MPSHNHVTLIGRLGHDPDVKLSGEQAMARLSLATDRPPRGDAPPEPDWHHIVCWGQLADFAARYLYKGRLVLVCGRLSYRSWETGDGKTAHTAEILAATITPLDRRPGGESETPLSMSEDDLSF